MDLSCTPLVSIVLLAYNHLDYTKLCVESLYRYTTDVSFELITVDNGSSDGTREYFNSLPNRKKLSFPENIGVDKAVNRGFRLAEGKYAMNLSNDIVVTANWLSNLVTCMESDEKIAMAVPVCGYSSNNQQVRLEYQTMEQMQLAARLHNRSNPLQWEERIRLVTYVCLFRNDLFKAIGGFDEEFNPGAYDDDAIGFTLRRAGYRLILAADTYVHHFGSITFNAEYTKSNIAARNRDLFLRKFGVHSWAAAMIDFNITGLVHYANNGAVRMLGTGRSCGSTLLQVKNLFRKRGVTDVCFDYFSEYRQNMADLATVCRECAYDPARPVSQVFGGRTYGLIIVENETDKLTDPGGFFKDLCSLLRPGGQLITTAAESMYPVVSTALTGMGLVQDGQKDNYYFSFSAQ